ncbi:MAG: glycosyltransferase [Ignavibacteriaceae bacterium]|nr:glycosyltransferase [Ignavibacteriaceae bacterium]
MNYKFLKVTSYYKSFLDYFYNSKIDIKSKNYDQHLNLLLSEAFGWGNFFQINLNKLGNDAYEAILNADSLQAVWAAENNLGFSSSEEIFFHQVKKIEPDVLFLQDVSPFDQHFLSRVRNEVKSVKLIIGWLCAPYTEKNLKTLASCDFVCSCSELFIKQLTDNGIKCYRLNHAFENSLLPKIVNNTYPQTDFLFVGSFFPGSELHDERVQVIEALLAEEIDMKIYTKLPKVSKLFVRKLAYQFYQQLKKYKLEGLYNISSTTKKVAQYKEAPHAFKLSVKFMKAVESKPVFGIEMLKAFSKAKLGFNSHGGVAGDYACNIRLFEVTGVGSCLVTDHKKNITDFFIPDKEIVTYKSVAECVEKAKWLLNHPNEMREIAASGQKRTLRDHTFYNRAVELDDIIKKELALKK